MKQNIMIVAVAVVAVAVIAAAYVLASGVLAPAVAAGDTVSVYYTGAFTNGTVFNSNIGAQPFQFTAGAGQVIPGFDNAVIGMRLNQTKTVTIPVNEAYGPVDPALIISVPANDFSGNTIAAGDRITRTEPNGQQVQGVVTAVNATNVTVDFNPPLAGHTLVFTIRVVGITRAPGS